MRPRVTTAPLLLAASLTARLLVGGPVRAADRATDRAAADLDRRFAATVRPFLAKHCLDCHGGAKPRADLDLGPAANLAAVVADFSRWTQIEEKLGAGEMPPRKAVQPTPADKQQVMAWIAAVRAHEARKHAGDPGPVLARRLSNAEYNHTIRDLTGVDLQPTREFPVDPANPAGFDNSGESLAMSPALLGKYLHAAREVASHLVLHSEGLAFAPHPMEVETDRDRYTVQRIVDFYQRQPTDLAAYFRAAWHHQNRAALGQARASLAQTAARDHVSARYLATIWQALQSAQESVGPLARLQTMFRQLPRPRGAPATKAAEAGCAQMRDYVLGLRKKLEPRFAGLATKTIRSTAQPFAMWKNRQYASHRLTCNLEALQIDGQPALALGARPADKDPGNDGADEDAPAARPPARVLPDPDLNVPAADRARHEAAFSRFCATFPDAFYVAERGRRYPEPSKEKGQLLSAGFLNLMGYFRDDQPLYQLVLDPAGQHELDRLWLDLDVVAAATQRTYLQFTANGDGPDAIRRIAGSTGPRPRLALGTEATTSAAITRLGQLYLSKAGADASAAAKQAITDHFALVDRTLRATEKAQTEAEPKQLQALLALAARAYRRPLTAAERDDLLDYYRQLRGPAGLDHEEALRDLLVSVLMSPDFCYRIDLVAAGPAVRPLSDHALASRLSYFLWSSMPDAELLAHADAGDLHQPKVLVAQARRMLQDARVRGLATEFGGGWLDFRRFEQHNAVDRQRFTSFDDDLRSAMAEEPIRFLLDVFGARDGHDKSVLDFLYGEHTFVNPVLAKHYGMPIAQDAAAASDDGWVRIADAARHGRGGLLPMAVFLTKNAPGLRTSPVKRGYWVVKSVLGERIPPPPAVVPELPRDEAKLELPLREVLARHREDPGCASCHSRFDALGLVFEGYGPIGEQRSVDLAGHPVDTRATFPGGKAMTGTGVEGLRQYLRAFRQGDFVDNLCRKLLAYALGRSLMLSDDATVAQMRNNLARAGHRFASLIDSIVTSPQFLTKRGPDGLALR